MDNNFKNIRNLVHDTDNKNEIFYQENNLKPISNDSEIIKKQVI
jgi:hypothetical protein